MVNDNPPAAVCCMCGDIGFPDKLFRCTKCHSRFQHSYCNNYYKESLEMTVCNWCRSEKRSSARRVVPSKRSVPGKSCGRATKRCLYSGDKIKQDGLDEREEMIMIRSNSSSVEYHARTTLSPRAPAGRRYKLLKDVLC